jgi:urea transporter
MMSRLFCWIAVAATLALATVIRYFVIELEILAHLCESHDAPWWCVVRAGAVAVLATQAPGIAALATGVVATFSRRSSWALAAACLGAAGLALYAAGTGAVGFLLGLLVLARSPASGSPDAHRESKA